MSRISDTGMWQHQPVDIRTLAGTVEELEAEIDRLQHRLSNQAATIRVQSETIRRLQEEAAEKSKRLDEVLESLKVTAIEQIHGETARIGQAVNFLCSIVDVYKRRLEQAESMPKQDATSPTDPPLPPNVANVPCEPVAVHPAPNVTRAGGE